MEKRKLAFRAAGKEIAVGSSPMVVGVLSSFSRNLAAQKYQDACDVVEVRLDCVPRRDGWERHCEKIQSLGWPVLLTLRLSVEGGGWKDADEAREPILTAALECAAGIDIELRSPLAAPLGKLAKKLGKVCVVSFHDFEKTPPLKRLEEIADAAHSLGSIAKIAAKIRNSSDVETLAALIDRKRKRPICVIGMGPEWAETRVSFARRGSCLTYGYLDKSTAPGQIPARELKKKLVNKAI